VELDLHVFVRVYKILRTQARPYFGSLSDDAISIVGSNTVKFLVTLTFCVAQATWYRVEKILCLFRVVTFWFDCPVFTELPLNPEPVLFASHHHNLFPYNPYHT
jgi:hypothetical protein